MGFFRQVGDDVLPSHTVVFPLPNGYFANIACEREIRTFDDIYMIIFSKQELSVPCVSRYPGFPEENLFLAWVCYASYYLCFFRCGTPRQQEIKESSAIMHYPHFFEYI